MAVNYTSARFSAEDDNGRPLVGGRLFTFQNGTTTPAVTYKDEAGTTPNTNPIVLDARGEAVAYLQDTQVYTFILQNRFGALIWSQNGITGAASSSSFLSFVADLLAGAGSALIGYIHNAVGAVRRSVLDRLRERLSIEDFGAVPGGVVDSSDAIIKAFSVAGRRLTIPDKVYKVTKTIPLLSDTDVVCEGEIVWAQDTVTLPRIGIFKTERGASNIRMVGMKFRNTSTFDEVVGVNIEVGHGVRLVRPVAIGCGVMQTFSTKPDGTVADYADVVTDPEDPDFNCSSDIHVVDYECHGRGATKHTAAVEMTYVINWSVIGGFSDNIRFGVQWWGGNANPGTDGAIANERKNKNGLVMGTTANHGLAGIWGSMGNMIRVIGCHAEYHDDVGIDPEGCSDTQIHDNTAAHCKNGCFPGFFHNRGVSIKGNKAFQDGSWGNILFKSYNSTNAAIPEYVIAENEWVYDGPGFGVVAYDPGLSSLSYRANKSTDAVMLGATNNMGHAFLEGNRWHFTKPLTDGTVVVNFGSNHGKSLIVDGNHMTSDVFQTNPNATLFFTLQNDANAAVPTRIRRNTVENFLGPKTFSVLAASPNPGIVMSFNFNDNNMDGGLPTDNSVPGKSTVQTSGNRDYFGVLIPGQTGN